MKLALIASLLLFSQIAFAKSAIGECTGTHDGVALIFKAKMSNKEDYRTAEGTLYYDDRPVADFTGRDDIKYSFFRMSFVMKNDRGDYVDGKVKNIFRKTGYIHSLKIPAHGIDISNFEINCWTKDL